MKRRFKTCLLVLAGMALVATTAFAQPASQRVGTQTLPEGPQRVHYVGGHDFNDPLAPEVVRIEPSAEQKAFAAQFTQRFQIEPKPLRLEQHTPIVRAQLSAEEAMFPPPVPPALAAPLTVPNVQCETQDFADDTTLTSFGFIPPDPHGTVGMNHALVINNVAIQGFDKACNPSADLPLQSLQSFFGGTPTFTFDPKARYDHFSDRYVVVSVERIDGGANPSAGNISTILVSASPPGTLLGVWNTVAINAKTTWPAIYGAWEFWCDYPGFAVDEEAIYVTCNGFGFPAISGFGGTFEFAIDKAQVYAGAVPAVYQYDAATAVGVGPATPACSFTHQPAHMHNNPGGAIGTWFTAYAGCSDGTNEYLQLIQIDNPLGGAAAVFSGPSYPPLGNIEDFATFLPGAPQQGLPNLISTNDQRALDAVYDGTDLFVTATIEPNAATSAADVGEATAVFFEMNTSAGIPGAITQMVIAGGEDLDPGGVTFFPSISANASQVVMGFAASSPNHWAGAYYTSFPRPGGPLSPTQIVREGRGPYHRDFGGGINRWGDYTAVALDPDGGNDFWIFNQYAQETAGGVGQGEWGQYLVEVDGPPTGPVNDDLIAPTYVTAIGPPATGNTNGADSEVGEAQPTCTKQMPPGTPNDAGNSVWFQYRPSVNGVADFTVAAAGDYVLSLHTGTGHPLTEVACADANGHGVGESITGFAVTGQASYFIRVAEYGAALSKTQAGFSFAVPNGPPPVTLPVELVDFVGLVDDGDIVLSWTTASETDNAGFEVQRRVDGDRYEILGFVDGHGSTLEPQRYSFHVADSEPGIHVFRLKQVDLDGAFALTQTVEVAVELPGEIWVGPAYPNPFNPITRFVVVVDVDQDVRVEIFDPLGRSMGVLHDGELPANQRHKFTLTADNLSSGTYLYRATGEFGASMTERVVLLK